MSRLGKLPIEIPKGTEVKLEDDFIIIKGPKGELKQKLHPAIKVEVVDSESGIEQIQVGIKNEKTPAKSLRDSGASRASGAGKKAKAFWGLYRSLINNIVEGVNNEFSKQLEINGVGYRAKAEGNKLVLSVGYSYPVNYELPEGINAKVEKNIITISGIDKQLVGEVAAQIRKIRKPEPYKGKGIKYVDEVIRRKAGKAVATTEK